MRDYLIIDGKNLSDYGVYLFGRPLYPFPERAVEKVEIPGRSGDVIIDRGRWYNFEAEFQIVVLGNTLDALRMFLLTRRGYVKIETSFEPDYYRKGRFIEAEVINVKEDAATLKLIFDCAPQRWLKRGNETISLMTGATVYNPTRFDAYPLIKLCAAAENASLAFHYRIDLDDGGTANFGWVRISVPQNQSLIIDCEKMNAVDNHGDDANQYVTITYNFPGDNEVYYYPRIMRTLGKEEADEMLEGRWYAAGSNYTSIGVSGMQAFTYCEMQPRWWTL